MIKDKKSIPQTQPFTDVSGKVTEPELVEENALAEMYLAVKRAVLTIREQEDNPDSPPFSRPYLSTMDSSAALS